MGARERAVDYKRDHETGSVCADARVLATAYEDEPEGFIMEQLDGSERFTQWCAASARCVEPAGAAPAQRLRAARAAIGAAWPPMWKESIVSKKKSTDTTRRAFLRSVAVAGSAVLVGLESAPAAAQGAQKLSTSDPLAKSLGYVEDAASVDKAKFPTYKPGQVCDKCRFYTGTAGASDGPCQIFAGKLVSAKGWCSSFVQKT